MTLLLFAVWTALVATVAAVLVNAAAVVRERLERWAGRSVWLAFAATAAPLLLLVVDFLAGRLDVFYVWENVHRSYPWWLRLAGVWGGQSGTFLLWGFFVLGAASLEQHRSSGNGLWRRARLILVVVALLLLVPAIVHGLGEPTDAYGLTGEGGLEAGAPGPSPLELRPDGERLNPLLESVYMAIHPVVEFLAYGLTAVPFAYGLVHLVRGGSYRERALPWARGAWLAFLTAITLGALWAYTVLSFGGYWIWDPVEVANLLPFLGLTLFLHAGAAQRRGHLGLLAPAAAVGAFALIVFGDFVVRSGLWSSVHAFLPTGLSIAIEDPTRRLLVAVQESFQARYATSLATMAIGTTAAATSAYHARQTSASGPRRRLWTGLALAYGVLGLMGLLAPEALVAAVNRVAVVIGFGRPLVGVAALTVLAVLPLVAGLFSIPESTPTSPRTRGGQLSLASGALVVALGATALLLVLGVNGYNEEVFTSRAPYLAGPILALVALAFHRGRFQRWAGAAAAALGLGLLLRWATGSWAWAAIPVALVPAAGALGLYVARARPTADRSGRLQALLVVVGGLAGLVQWSSPGTVAIAGVGVASPAAFVPVGLIASGAAVASPYLEGRRWPAWAGPVAAVLGIGYGVGIVLGLLALVLGPLRVQGPRGRMASGAVPLIHVGLAVLVLGVALSTYATTLTAFPLSDPLVRGQPEPVGDHTVELVDGSLVDEDGDGRPDIVSAQVHVRQDGTFLAEERLSLAFAPGAGFAGSGSFVPEESPVTRSWWGDLAHNADTSTPLAIRLGGGNQTWVTANGPPPASFPDHVEALSMGVKTLPGVNLVWAGVSVLWLGMAARLAPRRGRRAVPGPE